ncbi:hypothetical protein E2C01_058606 [Portunus trituberculatus]|uniref:Uncharacterized protein n=1 Tax=Portunus trituberculatus TaxID=210409 RepID=A0A5B7H3G1_PORTR|nr:hypothetical protein [Portunus trituberculatus]
MQDCAGTPPRLLIDRRKAHSCSYYNIALPANVLTLKWSGINGSAALHVMTEEDAGPWREEEMVWDY